MQKKNTGILSTAILIVAAVIYLYLESNPDKARPAVGTSEINTTQTAHSLIQNYYQSKTSGKMVTVTAEVSRVLSDDTHAPRHQRFIITLNSGLTVLVAHNIDLAPRVEKLNTGDEVTIKGQYEWNERGGVLHWTHHDPKGRRDGGLIQHKGKVYK